MKGSEKRRNGRNLEMGGEQLAGGVGTTGGDPEKGVGDGVWQGLASLQGSMHQ